MVEPLVRLKCPFRTYVPCTVCWQGAFKALLDLLLGIPLRYLNQWFFLREVKKEVRRYRGPKFNPQNPLETTT
jgi:hypothetical protein